MAMGLAYKHLLAVRTLLLTQLQSYGPFGPSTSGRGPRGLGRLYVRVVQVSGASGEDVHRFFAEGML